MSLKEKKVASLVDIIGLALNKRTYGRLVSNIEKGWDISYLKPEANSERARNHRSKILREETERQFRETSRPVIELILNAIDARPKYRTGLYEVAVKTNGKCIDIIDRGEGMSLEGILTTLLIPFSSDKDSSTDIGRFGVGFFSSLKYCTQDPNKARLTVQTTKSGVRHDVEIYSTGPSVDQLQCCISRSRGTGNGTRILLHYQHEKKEMVEFIERYLRTFDSARAIINVNRKAINVPKKNKKFKSSVAYEIPFDTKDSRTAKLRFRIDPTKDRGSIALYSQGVEICNADTHGYRAMIDLPSDILLVEGRDEFKRDLSYMNAFTELIAFACQNSCLLGRRAGKNFDVLEFIPEIVKAGQVSGDTIKRNIEKYIRHLFGKDTYIVRDFDGLETTVTLTDFFGDELPGKIYAPPNLAVLSFWSSYLPGMTTFIKDNAHPVQIGIEELINSSPSLSPLSKELIGIKVGKISPVVLKHKQEPRSPFLDAGSSLYINVRHSLLMQDDPMSRYMTRCYLFSSTEKPEEAENKLIRRK